MHKLSAHSFFTNLLCQVDILCAVKESPFSNANPNWLVTAILGALLRALATMLRFTNAIRGVGKKFSGDTAAGDDSCSSTKMGRQVCLTASSRNTVRECPRLVSGSSTDGYGSRCRICVTILGWRQGSHYDQIFLWTIAWLRDVEIAAAREQPT